MNRGGTGESRPAPDCDHRRCRFGIASLAIADIAGGLAAFRKYIPADFARTLLREGVEPQPGGSVRTLTVMF